MLCFTCEPTARWHNNCISSGLIVIHETAPKSSCKRGLNERSQGDSSSTEWRAHTSCSLRTILRIYPISLKFCPRIPQEPCIFIKFCSNFAQKFHKTVALDFYQTLLKFHKTVALHFYQILPKFCPKNPQDYSRSFLLNFAQIFPNNSTRLQPCVFIKFCSNITHKFH